MLLQTWQISNIRLLSHHRSGFMVGGGLLKAAVLPLGGRLRSFATRSVPKNNTHNMLIFNQIKDKIGGFMNRYYGTCEHAADLKFTVAIEGNIGSGKTTLLKYYEDSPSVEVIQEPVTRWRNIEGHNALGLMYKDPSRWALTFQTYVQLTMLQTHVQKQKAPVKLMERSIYSAKYCFAENLHRSGKMPDIEHIILDQWFKWIIENHDCDIDLIVYLRTDPEVVYERIKKRCRKEEQHIPMDYLQRLHDLHEEWLMEKKFPVNAPVLVLDGNKTETEITNVYEERRQHILGGYS